MKLRYHLFFPPKPRSCLALLSEPVSRQPQHQPVWRCLTWPTWTRPWPPNPVAGRFPHCSRRKNKNWPPPTSTPKDAQNGWGVGWPAKHVSWHCSLRTVSSSHAGRLGPAVAKRLAAVNRPGRPANTLARYIHFAQQTLRCCHGRHGSVLRYRYPAGKHQDPACCRSVFRTGGDGAAAGCFAGRTE